MVVSLKIPIKFMHICRQTQVFCGTAEPFVMDLSMIGVSGSAVAWIHYQSAGAFLT